MMPVQMLRRFFQLESSGGLLLAISALIALIIENTPLRVYYDLILTTPVAVQVGTFILKKPFLLWVNDGFMAIFFLLVGLELKREMLEGQFSNREQISLPLVAALGGLVMPTAIYSYINWQNPVALQGWAIPAATDIAFALGALALLGKRIPEALKICLVAIAILDDLAAIIIIACFYTPGLSLASIEFALLAIAILATLNYRRVTTLTPYALAGLLLWVAVLKSGVHATLAGVILAFFIPLRELNANGEAPLRLLEDKLHPWVAFAILPIFAFANAGVSFEGFTLAKLGHAVTLGIILGLVVGKPLGVLSFTLMGRLLRICRLPKVVSWAQFTGLALLTGIGFTMSLFIGTLAFETLEYQTAVRVGVIVGTLVSGLIGCGFLSLIRAQ